LKQALRILLAVYDNIEKVKDPNLRVEILDEKFTVAAVLLDTVKELLVNILQPHLKTKSINRVNDTFNQIARRDFLLKAFSEESLKPDVHHVVNFTRSYIKKS